MLLTSSCLPVLKSASCRKGQGARVPPGVADSFLSSDLIGLNFELVCVG